MVRCPFFNLHYFTILEAYTELLEDAHQFRPTMKYLPFLSGTYSTAPGLVSILKAEGLDSFIFQIDDTYRSYLNNKDNCRKENIHKYYCEERLQPETIQLVNRYLVDQLSKEYPNHFAVDYDRRSFVNRITEEQITWTAEWQLNQNSRYETLFDALCCQVQEDLAVFQLSNNEDWLASIHLCAPNHWAPGDKIGKPFQAVHAPVPGMEKTLQHYRRMLESVVNASSPFTRFAWGVATDTRLNHHPQAPLYVDDAYWQGRDHHEKNTWFIRTERQNLVGFAKENAFLFTIRTYFYRIDELTVDEKKLLLKALQSMSSDSLQYKGLSRSLSRLEDFLKTE